MPKLEEGKETNAEDFDSIRAEAIRELEEEKNGKKKDPDEGDGEKTEKPAEEKNKPAEDNKPEELSEDDLIAADESELSEEQKTKRSEVIKTRREAEEARLLSAKDEDLSEEDKAAKTELLKYQEAAKTEAAKKELADYAKEHKITEEQAKEELESIEKIQDKYKRDPKQLAKANLHLQRLYARSEAEFKALKEAKSQPVAKEVTPEGVEQWINSGNAILGGKPLTKEAVLEAYRKAYPDITEEMEDEKVMKLAVKEYAMKINEGVSKEKADRVIKAREKRATLFDSVQEADKKYIEEIKPLIENLTADQLLADTFTIDTYISFAKGQHFDEEVQRLEKEKQEFGEKEYRRGLAEAKIIGVKRTPGTGGAPPKVKEAFTLTEAQKKRAVEMFDTPGITEEEAYKLYKEFLTETNQK